RTAVATAVPTFVVMLYFVPQIVERIAYSWSSRVKFPAFVQIPSRIVPISRASSTRRYLFLPGLICWASNTDSLQHDLGCRAWRKCIIAHCSPEYRLAWQKMLSPAADLPAVPPYGFGEYRILSAFAEPGRSRS